MAYPYRITDTAFPTIGKPILHGTDLYQLIRDQTPDPALPLNDNLQIWKSTDAGVTSPWTPGEVDSANHPVIENNSVVAIESRYDGSRIWTVYIATATGAARLHALNLSTGLWEAAILGGPLPETITGTPGSHLTIHPARQLGLAVRTNGDKVVFFSRVEVVLGVLYYHAIYAQVYASGAWGAAFPVMAAGISESGSAYYDYAYVGSAVGTGGRIGVWAWTANGWAFATVESDNSVTNYRRMDMDDLSNNYQGNPYGGWGLPEVVTFGSTQYFALPIGTLSNVDGLSNYFRPSLYLIKNHATPGPTRLIIMEERAERATNWNSVVIDYDSSTGSTYLVWTRFPGDPTFDYQTDIRISCTSDGTVWSDPSTLFTSGTNELIESVEITVSSGVLRALFENSNGVSPYLWPHYYQAAVASCGSVAPPAAGGNSAWLGEG